MPADGSPTELKGRKLTLSQSDFEIISKLVKARMGIVLTWDKADFVVSRLEAHVLELGIASFGDYARLLGKADDTKAMSDLANLISTNFTFFNRESEHFELMRTRVLPDLMLRIDAAHAPRVLRLWSAACSTGEEPYTMAMTLAESLRGPSDAWDTGILATDISERALAVGTAGIYSSEQVASLPESWRARHFQQTSGGKVLVHESIRSHVLFRKFNLISSPFRFKRPFDVIVCRNVMIYFDDATRADLIGRFTDVLAPGGYLFVGHAEPIVIMMLRADKRYEPVHTSVFQRRI